MSHIISYLKYCPGHINVSFVNYWDVAILKKYNLSCGAGQVQVVFLCAADRVQVQGRNYIYMFLRFEFWLGEGWDEWDGCKMKLLIIKRLTFRACVIAISAPRLLWFGLFKCHLGLRYSFQNTSSERGVHWTVIWPPTEVTIGTISQPSLFEIAPKSVQGYCVLFYQTHLWAFLLAPGQRNSTMLVER